MNRVMPRANSPRDARILTLVGADEIVFVEQELGRRIAARILGPGG